MGMTRGVENEPEGDSLQGIQIGDGFFSRSFQFSFPAHRPCPRVATEKCSTLGGRRLCAGPFAVSCMCRRLAKDFTLGASPAEGTHRPCLCGRSPHSWHSTRLGHDKDNDSAELGRQRLAARESSSSRFPPSHPLY